MRCLLSRLAGFFANRTDAVMSATGKVVELLRTGEGVRKGLGISSVN